MKIVNAPLSISPSTIPDGVVGQPYSQQLTPSGGTGTGYAFDMPTSTIPPGLSLSPNGLISGTPTQAGTFNLAIRLTDGSGANNFFTY
jgi:large repetitive protein